MAGDSSVELTASDGCLVARVGGELDYVSRQVLMEKLRQLVARGHRFIVLDLSGVTFCDSAGLNVLPGPAAGGQARLTAGRGVCAAAAAAGLGDDRGRSGPGAL